jgi:hypothetical protein
MLIIIIVIITSAGTLGFGQLMEQKLELRVGRLYHANDLAHRQLMADSNCRTQG